MNIIQTMTSGDSANWLDDAWVVQPSGERLTSAAWTLTYELRGPGRATLTAVPSGDGWKTTLDIAASAALLAGSYLWAAYLSKTGERLTIGRGVLTVADDLTNIDENVDARTLAQRAVEDCEAALANFNSSGGKIKSYTIGTRQTEFHTLADIMTLLNYWKLRLANERARASVANGNGNPRKLLVRFS